MADKPVVIIGAGCAGLAAAYELKKRGVDVLVLESTNRYGGRTGAVHYDPDHPEYYYSYGAVFTEPNNDAQFGYVHEFGLEDTYVPMDRKVYGMWNNNELSYIIDDGNLFAAMLGLKGLPLSIVPQGAKFLKNVGKAAKNIDGENFDGLMDIASQSTEEWTLKNAGDQIVDKLIGPMLQAMVGERASQISIAHPIALLSGMQGMGQFKGTHAVVNDRIFDAIKDSVRFSTPVAEILIDGSQVTGVRLENGDVIDADYVICCTDAPEAIRLMPNAPAKLLDELGEVRYSCMYQYVFRFDERIVPDDFALIFLPMSTNPRINTVFDENIHDICGPKGASVMHVFTSAWHDDEYTSLDDDAREAEVRKEAAKYLPVFAEKGTCVGYNRFDRAISIEAPKQVLAIHEMKNTYKDEIKGLRLAGEYLELIASSEGAHKYGRDTGRELAAELGK